MLKRLNFKSAASQTPEEIFADVIASLPMPAELAAAHRELAEARERRETLRVNAAHLRQMLQSTGAADDARGLERDIRRYDAELAEADAEIARLRRVRADLSPDYAEKLNEALRPAVELAADDIIASVESIRSAMSVIREAALLARPAHIGDSMYSGADWSAAAFVNEREIQAVADFAKRLVTPVPDIRKGGG